MENLINGPQIAMILACVVAMNILLAGAAKALEAIKDKTATDVDNKIYAVISKISGFLSKALDIMGANREHK